MSRLTVRLPETLHQKLVDLAQKEGVSLNQYIVYALANQVDSSYTTKDIPNAEVIKQAKSFSKLLQTLGSEDESSVEAVLAQREQVLPEDGLNQEIVNCVSQRIQALKSL